MATIRQRHAKTPFDIHHDALTEDESVDGLEGAMDESRDMNDDVDALDECYDSEESDTIVDPAVREDMDKFLESFKGMKERFRLINRIGEGTFSTVYKAEDLNYDHYHNDWDLEEKENASTWKSPTPKRFKQCVDQHGETKRKPKYVAIKKIYVTSSPARILNELELLHDLERCNSLCPLITAFRNTDQVVAVLPYFRHTDFRDYFRNMLIPEVKTYFRSLFTALGAVHDKGILHRDIKPTNFLYDVEKERGVLVDFGLAEREGTDTKPCLCHSHPDVRRKRLYNSVTAAMGPSSGYPKSDSRPSRRANRAGTRGFRAPEVLFKCTEQTTKIDIWSAGVILLTILSRRFPFFNSADDVEAMIEIATMYGVKKMKQCAQLHGAVLESTIPTIGQQGFTIEKIILWSTMRNAEDGGASPLNTDELLAVKFLERCLELDPNKRISAREALVHEFLRVEEEVETEYDDEIEMV
ncbi:kinase-like domain-containing protein [Amylocarpus encephaloides]|uniref:non-specific serine/threonine protein kinase n=1 Tax=Amylocarpus encephaloides TaxID=45428 RepID=A0A9P8C0F0_9HELO|nr:kinase-like domain-containing protein [Amylocarpus encephaloides]